jgi:cobalt-zinc-cadmium resistance protein CzcA
MAFVMTVVLLGFSGGVLALFVRGIHVERTAVAGFCVVSALAIVQSWMVASEIAKVRRLSGDIRNACYRGAQAKCRAVSLVGLCAIAGVLPQAFTSANSGAPGRFATVMVGGVVFSTIAALTVLPVLIARIAERDRFIVRDRPSCATLGGKAGARRP